MLPGDRAKIVDHLETKFIAARFHHSQQEDCFRTILRDKTLRHARVLRLLHDLHHFFVTDQERKRRAIAFGQEGWQRNHRPDVVVIFERSVQRPHFLISGISVELAAVGR